MRTILLIEDDQIIRENTKELLELHNFEVSTAANGNKGIKLATNILPDLIICDIMMPEGDGYKVLTTLSKNDSTAYIPFIFLSAKTEHRDIRKGMDLGADDYLTKPYENEELLSAVESRLAKTAILNRIKGEATGATANSKGQKEFKTLDALRNHMDDNGEIFEYDKGAMIYEEGDASNYIYLLLKGVVKIFTLEENGKELTTTLYKADDFFGFTSLTNNSPRRDKAKALKPVRLAAISKQEFKNILENSLGLSLDLLNLFTSNLSEFRDHLVQMAYGSVKKKTAQSILQFAEILQKDKNQSITIARSDLANVAGIAKESLIRALSEFKKQGIIEITDKNIKILNIDKLNKIK